MIAYSLGQIAQKHEQHDQYDQHTVTQAQVRSLMQFPARWLVDLPEPIRVRLEVAGAPVPIAFAAGAASAAIDDRPSSSRASQTRSSLSGSSPAGSFTEEAPVLAASICYTADEVRALVLGIEADRIWHREFLGFCFEKWRKPSFRVSIVEALDGANPDYEQPAWSFERILRRLQARITGVEVVATAQPLAGMLVAA